MHRIPATHEALLYGPVVVALTTLMPDGQPQTTPVWCSYDGRYVYINTARGRQKDENIRRDPRVTLLAIDPADPYRYVEVRGVVDDITTEGAVAHIDELVRQYTDLDRYFGGFAPAGLAEKMVRVKMRVQPTDGSTAG